MASRLRRGSSHRWESRKARSFMASNLFMDANLTSWASVSMHRPRKSRKLAQQEPPPFSRNRQSPISVQSAQNAVRGWQWEMADHETAELVQFHFTPN